MNTFQINRRHSASILRCGLMLTATLFSQLEAAVVGTKPWTTIGSAGSEHLGTYTYQNGIAFLSSNSGILRYNVVAVDGLLDKGGPLPSLVFIKARFRDSGAGARVTVNLRRTRISDGFTANVPGKFIDSNNYPGGDFQTREVYCSPAADFDFVNYVYYVEVIMTRDQGVFAPAIEAIQVGWTTNGCLLAPQ